MIVVDSTTVLADASDQELRDYQASLRKLKNRASTDLQQNVYQNRTRFIKISKDAEKLNDEMRNLRSQLAEVSSTVSNLMSKAGIPESRPAADDMATRSRKQANRSSVANLEAMWNVQLHELWKTVEGSQKFLPAIPGRHVVNEQRHWVELDAATWKTKKKAAIILLNDHLLIATEKKMRTDPSPAADGEPEKKAVTKLVAEKCWPLQDMNLLDLAATSDARDKHAMANAINIRCGHESYTYRSAKVSDKTDILRAFRTTSEELRRTLRADTESTAKSKENMNYQSAKEPVVSETANLLGPLSNSKNPPEILIDVDGKQRNLRWFEGQIDELDIQIALQHFEDAVRHVEKLRKLAKGLKGNATAQDLITTKVDGRANKLAGTYTGYGSHARGTLANAASRSCSPTPNGHPLLRYRHPDKHRLARPPRLRRPSPRIVP